MGVVGTRCIGLQELVGNKRREVLATYIEGWEMQHAHPCRQHACAKCMKIVSGPLGCIHGLSEYWDGRILPRIDSPVLSSHLHLNRIGPLGFHATIFSDPEIGASQ